MRQLGWSLILAVLAAGPLAADDKSDGGITWKKTVIDKTFRSEGVALADVNRDGKIDVLVGEVWYEAPDWKMHEIRKPGNYGDGLKGYSQSFCCWADDINGDGWVDLIVIGFPGAPCHWYENPKGAEGHWKQHVIWHSACKTPQYADLFKNGKRVLVMGWQPKGKDNQGQMAYFSPGKDPTQLWEMHPISEPSPEGKPIPGTFRFAHGLGIGDVNGDGRLDVICTAGWWEQPAGETGAAASTDKPWKFHPAALGDACADMFVYDIDGDGKADILSSSAHKYGIWAYQQRPATKEGEPTFLKQVLFKELVSETHAMACVDVNGDGLKDLITGKRWWSHGKSEPGSDKPAMLYWLEARKKDGIVTFLPHEIDNDSGIGTQFAVLETPVAKLGGTFTPPTIAVANKKGVFLFEPVPTKR